MTQEEIKKYLQDNLRINAEIEDGYDKRLVITLSLGREVISETKLWI